MSTQPEDITPKKNKIKKIKSKVDVDNSSKSLIKPRKSSQQKWFETTRKIINNIKWENTKKYRKSEIEKIKSKKQFTARGYALEYMLEKGVWLKVKDVGKHVSDRKFEDTGEVVGDPPRQFELLRKNILPLSWLETKIKRDKYVCFCPERVFWQDQEVINNSKHKNQNFSNELITTKLSECKYICELTHLPMSEGSLAADHWIPKEGGGKSELQNCVIINKILNEKKNKYEPVNWFCKSLLTNFLKICNKTGMNMNEVKDKLIKFIQEF